MDAAVACDGAAAAGVAPVALKEGCAVPDVGAGAAAVTVGMLVSDTPRRMGALAKGVYPCDGSPRNRSDTGKDSWGGRSWGRQHHYKRGFTDDLMNATDSRWSVDSSWQHNVRSGDVSKHKFARLSTLTPATKRTSLQGKKPVWGHRGDCGPEPLARSLLRLLD